MEKLKEAVNRCMETEAQLIDQLVLAILSVGPQSARSAGVYEQIQETAAMRMRLNMELTRRRRNE